MRDIHGVCTSQINSFALGRGLALTLLRRPNLVVLTELKSQQPSLVCPVLRCRWLWVRLFSVTGRHCVAFSKLAGDSVL